MEPGRPRRQCTRVLPNAAHDMRAVLKPAGEYICGT